MLRGWRRLEGDSVKCSGVKSDKGEELQEGKQNAWVKIDFTVTMGLAARRPPRPLEEQHQMRTLG